MTDIFGTVYSATQIVAMIVKYGKEAHGAYDDMMILQDEINSSCRVLNKIVKVFDDPEKRKQPDVRDWIEPLKESKKRHDEKLKYIENKIRKIESGHGGSRLSWPLQKGDFRSALTEMKACHTNFSTFLEVMNFEGMKRLETDFYDLQLDLNTEKDQSRFQKAIEWLCSDRSMSNMDDKLQKESIKSRDSEPDWILKHDPYREWISDLHGKSNWLWGFGEPGSGKTCIASFLARELAKDPPQYEAGDATKQDQPHSARKAPVIRKPPISSPSASSIAYFYCSYKDTNDDQDAETVLKCLCRQLLLQIQRLDTTKAKARAGLVERLRTSKTSRLESGNLRSRTSGPDDTGTLLEILVNDFPRSYLVIDALDENTSGYNDLLSELERLQSSSLRIFVTSRDGVNGNLRRYAEDLNAIKLHVHPEDKQIRSYVSSRLDRIAVKDEREIPHGSELVRAVATQEQRSDIVEKVVRAAAGNFLCAELQIAGLKICTGSEELDARLADLPGTLEALFQDVIDRIEAQPSANAREIGKRTLLWTIYARKSLSIAEVKHALATYSLRPNRPAVLKEDAGPSIREITDSTRYFLRIDDKTTTIQIHKSIREFCENPEIEDRYFDNAQYQMAKICLQYLQLDDLRSGPCTSMSEWQERVHKYPFLDYAVRNWGEHMKLCSEGKFEEIQKQAMNMLQKRCNVSSIGQALQPALHEPDFHEYARGSSWAEQGKDAEPIMPALHLLTYFGLGETTQEWMRSVNKDPNFPSPSNVTPLFLACRTGRSNMVELLLEHGADPRLPNTDKRFCLAAGALWGFPDIVRMLLAHKPGDRIGEELTRQNNWYGRSSLSDAAHEGRKNIVDMLLEYMKTMDDGLEVLLHQDDNGNTAMHEAALMNHTNVIESLVEFSGGNALLNKPQNRHWRDFPLHLATGSVRPEAIETLLRLGADIEAKQSQGKTSLILAVQHVFASHSKIIDLLLKKGANPATRDNDGKTALHCAADHGRPRNVRLLLSHGHKNLVTEKDDDGHSPITRAAKFKTNDWAGVVQVLCEPAAAPIEPKHDCEPRFQCLRSLRSEVLFFTEDSRDQVYLLSQPIPENVLVHRIAFTIVGRDQGYSDHSKNVPHIKGTYQGSATWFDIGILRNGSLHHQTEITRNKHAWEEWESHDMFWGIARAHFGAGSRRRDSGSQEQVFNFLKALQPGDRIAVVPKAVWKAWLNIVAKVELTIFYVENDTQSAV